MVELLQVIDDLRNRVALLEMQLSEKDTTVEDLWEGLELEAYLGEKPSESVVLNRLVMKDEEISHLKEQLIEITEGSKKRDEYLLGINKQLDYIREKLDVIEIKTNEL